MNSTVTEIYPQIAIYHDERLVRVAVFVPEELALQLHDLELIVVHLSDNFWLPLLIKQGEFLREADRSIAHHGLRLFSRECYGAPPTVGRRQRRSPLIPK